MKPALLLAALLAAYPAGSAGRQRVMFRFVSGPDGASYMVQPMLPMKLRITKLDASQVLRLDDFGSCEVFNAKDDNTAHLRCDGVEFKVTGMQFELEKP